VADLVAAAIEIASPAIENGRHTLVVKVPKQGIVVDVDRVRMTQVLVNLLTNAAKYTPVGGRIYVKAACEGTDVVISVEDTGVGISAELLPRLFDLFVQARQTLDRTQGGLGLGLALVKNLIAMHGGTVSAHSLGLGRGSTFTVRLPRSEAAPTKERPALPSIAAAETHEQRLRRTRSAPRRHRIRPAGGAPRHRLACAGWLRGSQAFACSLAWREPRGHHRLRSGERPAKNARCRFSGASNETRGSQGASGRSRGPLRGEGVDGGCGIATVSNFEPRSFARGPTCTPRRSPARLVLHR
jgi:anti-sigma regulatory factor (Ser/Thr protein kinase)